jgi:hypothetical protein
MYGVATNYRSDSLAQLENGCRLVIAGSVSSSPIVAGGGERLADFQHKASHYALRRGGLPLGLPNLGRVHSTWECA